MGLLRVSNSLGRETDHFKSMKYSSAENGMTTTQGSTATRRENRGT